jgi:uridine phosphorylase
LKTFEDNPFPFTTPEDLHSPTLFTAAHQLEQLRNPGMLPIIPSLERVVLLHQAGSLRAIARKYRLRRARGFHKELYLLREKGGTIGVVTNFGVGAPASAVIIEELAVLGIKKLITLGIAGGLQEHMQPGDLAICERAIREEGTSYHYSLPSRYAFPSTKLTQDFVEALDKMGHSCNLGTSWTTDAPYRETRRKVEHYRRCGVATVEMEAAAAFAVCTYLGIESAAAFTIADTVREFSWQPEHDQKVTRVRLAILLEAALQVLEK